MPSSLSDQWKQTKAAFETASKRKKPSEKLYGIFRKGTGLEPAFAALDRAIDKVDLDECKKALAVATKAANAYQVVLIREAKTKDTDIAVAKNISVMLTDMFKILEDAKGQIADAFMIPRLSSLADFTKLMRSKGWERFQKLAVTGHNLDSVRFLEAMAKKNHSQKTYDEFIVGRHAINIKDNIQNEFEANKGDLKKCPWDDATKEILLLLTDDVVQRANKEVDDVT